MQVSITKAAQLADVSRTTLYNDMNSGKITYVSTGKNKKEIDVSELERVYGRLNTLDNKSLSSNVKTEQNLTTSPDNSLVELAVLREKVSSLETERNRERTQLQERIEQLQNTLEKSQENQNKTTLLLEHYTKESGGAGDWQQSLKTLETRIANREKEETHEKEALRKQNEELITLIKKQEEAQTKVEEDEKAERIRIEKEYEASQTWVSKMFGKKKTA